MCVCGICNIIQNFLHLQAIVVESPAKNMSRLPILEDSSDTKNRDDSTNNFTKSPFVFEERKTDNFLRILN